MNRPQSFQPFSSPIKPRKLPSTDEEKKDIWSTLLDTVASGKRLPEKNLIILGGSTVTQKELLETLDSESARRPQERNKRKPPVANEFALGYTYQDVLDADQEDILARLSIYTLPDASSSFAPLLSPLLTQTTIPETLLVILLDWTEPWNWVRQIRGWIQFLRGVLTSLDDDAKEVMQEIMQEWEQRRRGGSHDASGGGMNNEANVNVPLGSGEWDEALGLPLCVVCHNSDKIDILEKEYSWREEDFDYVLQFLRTILLKHGASLIYTSNSVPNSLPLLIQSSLDIHSTLKRQLLKHNVVDREKIIIPPNWDSWGKIRVLREGFDVEGISDGWSLEIQPQRTSHTNVLQEDPASNPTSPEMNGTNSEPPDGLLRAYEEVVKNPKAHTIQDQQTTQPKLEVEIKSMQSFLADQYELIERLKIEEDLSPEKDASNTNNTRSLIGSNIPTTDDSSRVNEHIGPVHFNMGGIQVDAEDMLKRVKEREREETPELEGGRLPTAPSTPSAVAAPDGKGQNEALANFFAGLIKRGNSGSPRTPQG